MKKKEKKFDRLKSKIKFLLMYVNVLVLTVPNMAFADTTKSRPSFITNLINLADDFCTWAIVADVSIASLVCVYHGIKWKMASKDKRPLEVDAIKETVVAAIVVAIIGAVLKFILSYFTTTTV
jgi:ABC-type phosphate/phosphonate transport system permease subunit